MSPRGDCYDNTVMKSFFSTVRSELADRFDGGRVAKRALFDYIEVFYSRRRPPLSTCDSDGTPPSASLLRSTSENETRGETLPEKACFTTTSPPNRITAASPNITHLHSADRAQCEPFLHAGIESC
jgi:hypothetical protein